MLGSVDMKLGCKGSLLIIIGAYLEFCAIRLISSNDFLNSIICTERFEPRADDVRVGDAPYHHICQPGSRDRCAKCRLKLIIMQ